MIMLILFRRLKRFSFAAINQEKTIQNIESFDKSSLKHSETEVKNPFPDKQAINQEKTIQNIEGFDKKSLKPTETEVKNPLPDKTTIAEEKQNIAADAK